MKSGQEKPYAASCHEELVSPCHHAGAVGAHSENFVEGLMETDRFHACGFITNLWRHHTGWGAC